MRNDVDEMMRREAAALWEAVFGGPPAADADPKVMLGTIVRHLETKDYARLYAADRAHGLVWPRYETLPETKIRSF